MPDHFGIEFRWIGDCRRRFRSAVAFSLAFKALNLMILAPPAAGALHLCLARWGRASVGNFELVSFFLSPEGVAALLGVGALLVASLYLEISGLIGLLADDRLTWWEAFKGSVRRFFRLALLGLVQLGMFLVLAVPFLAGIAVVYQVLLRGKDLNGVIILKPPEFWWAAGLAGGLVCVYGLLAIRLFLRQSYAVAVLTLEPGTTALAAQRASAQRSRGTFWRCARTVAVWALIQFVLSAAVAACLQFVLPPILKRSDASLATAVLASGTVLVVNALATATLGILGTLTFAGVLLSLYRRVAPAGVLHTAGVLHAAPLEMRVPRKPLFRRSAGVALFAGAVVAVVLCYLSFRGLRLDEGLEITAHRAGATNAPENTVAALRQAIADRADWVEIDVQLTSDKELVVMHDTDLARVGGGDRRVDQATLAEIRALDVGGAFGPQFAGERIPALGEFLDAAGDRIRLNVELKPHGNSDGPELTHRVIAAIRQARMVARCRLCSQSYESLQLARDLEPGLEVGYVVATAVGDPTSLDVNFLMVKSDLATRQFVARARSRGIDVHAWTVNDPAMVAPLLDAGVANLITDDPAGMRAQLDTIRALSTPDRLLLRAGHAIAP